MKVKVNEKLVLNKSTIANLGNNEMENLKGGTGWCSDEHSDCVGVSFCGSVDPCYG